MISFSIPGAICAASLLGLSWLSISSAPVALAAQDHGGHAGHSAPAAVAQAAGGAPYLLDIDPVSGKSLGPIEHQVRVTREGREFRFADQKNADAFTAAPEKYVPGVDAKLIAQQMPFYPLDVCVVSGDKLGKKDVVDFVYLDRLVRVANAEHKATFLKDPASFVAKLDAAVIDKQKAKYKLTTCVVSGEKLGTMGDPIDRVVGNRLVRFCCKSCPADFDKDPLKYLAKLDGKDKEKDPKGGADKAATYTCPMHPDVVKSEPGRCPKCGMDLVKKK